jgi:hypothetical protein
LKVCLVELPGSVFAVTPCFTFSYETVALIVSSRVYSARNVEQPALQSPEDEQSTHCSKR